MIDLDEALVGMRCKINVDPRPEIGHIIKVGRKYIKVQSWGTVRSCLPQELFRLGEPIPHPPTPR